MDSVEPKDNLSIIRFKCMAVKNQSECVYYKERLNKIQNCLYWDLNGNCLSKLANVNKAYLFLKKELGDNFVG